MSERPKSRWTAREYFITDPPPSEPRHPDLEAAEGHIFRDTYNRGYVSIGERRQPQANERFARGDRAEFCLREGFPDGEFVILRPFHHS